MVDGDDGAFGVDRRDLSVQRAEDGAPERVAFEHRLERGVERGDIDDGPDIADEDAVLVDAWDTVIEDPAVLAVLPAQSIVDRERAALGHRLNVRLMGELAVLRVDALDPRVGQLVAGLLT